MDFLRKICLQWPHVTEEIKWDHDLCFCVAGKMFCVAGLEPPFRISFKVSDEEFEELSNSAGFMPAPYMARAKWVSVTEPAAISRAGWETFLKGSYEKVVARMTKKTRKELGFE